MELEGRLGGEGGASCGKGSRSAPASGRGGSETTARTGEVEHDCLVEDLAVWRHDAPQDGLALWRLAPRAVALGPAPRRERHRAPDLERIRPRDAQDRDGRLALARRWRKDGRGAERRRRRCWLCRGGPGVGGSSRQLGGSTGAGSPPGGCKRSQHCEDRWRAGRGGERRELGDSLALVSSPTPPSELSKALYLLSFALSAPQR